jgi:hypothetical protein
MIRSLLLSVLCLLLVLCNVKDLKAQVYANKVVGKSNKGVVDSLEHADYPYILPIWGEAVAKKGFKLPYSAGLSMQFVTQESDIAINNLSIGFNNGPMHSLTEVVRFNNATAQTSGINIRPDIWLLPFLNVYGLFAQSKSSTAIDAGIWVPDSTNTWHEVMPLSTKANFTGTTVGFGLTPTMGIGGGWLALDMNFAWTDIEALDAPAYTFVFGPRMGKTFKLDDEEMNVAVWVGGFRLLLSSSTSGSLNLEDLFDMDGLQGKVDNGIIKVEDAQDQVNTWWGGLTPVEQKNPINKAKYETANRAIDAASGFLTSIDGALNDEQKASVQYSLQKSPKDKWNFIVGTQFQLNKSLMFRAEYGFLGSRTQFIGGIQYRFGL